MQVGMSKILRHFVPQNDTSPYPTQAQDKGKAHLYLCTVYRRNGGSRRKRHLTCTAPDGERTKLRGEMSFFFGRLDTASFWTSKKKPGSKPFPVAEMKVGKKVRRLIGKHLIRQSFGLPLSPVGEN